MVGNSEHIYVVRMDVHAAYEKEFNDIYEREHIPTILRAPGVISATRYRTLDASVPKYLAIYKISGPDVPHSDEFRTLADSGEWPHRVRPYTSNRSRVVYERITYG